ncbi:MAG: type IX secretion system membrane protein PorP/SprF [Flavobacteriales bacterium]|nr:type IX secretion system membrane protein PorP/SprF [Flavobacteriales bacterium]
MKKTFTVVASLALLFIGTTVFAQQDPQLTMNMFNRLYANAGYAGSNNGICANALHRQQWVGFNGRPITTLINVDGTVKVLHGGVGISILSDKLGAQYSGGVKLSYAYRHTLGPGTIGVGVDVGFLYNTLDGSQLDPIQEGDPNIVNSKSSGIAPDLGVGVYYHTDNLYAGISANHLIGPTIKFEQGSTLSKYTVARHYYAMAGYTWHLPNPDWALNPSIFLKTDAASVQFDINVRALWRNMVWAGVSYRIDDAVGVMAGVQIKQFRVGYSYDITTSGLNKYSSGSHEIMLGYCYKLKSPVANQRYRNVRFL